jgi:glycosyltransferase involved in cell wall biosynthesis
MADEYNITLILPAYNEAATIKSTLSEAVAYFRRRALTYQIIVSADGNDGTREVARSFAEAHPSVHVIGEPVRCGKGRGIREAVKIATGDIVGFADADNKVPITEFDKLERWLQEGYDLAIGSRGLQRSTIERKQPWYRRVGSRGFYYFMHAVVGMPGIEDTQCGFKFFHRAVAQDLFSRQQIDGYMFDVEILALAQRRGYQIKEVPIRWHDDADSRLRLVAGNLRNVADIFKIRFSSLRNTEAQSVVRAKATIG